MRFRVLSERNRATFGAVDRFSRSADDRRLSLFFSSSLPAASDRTAVTAAAAAATAAAAREEPGLATGGRARRRGRGRGEQQRRRGSLHDWRKNSLSFSRYAGAEQLSLSVSLFLSVRSELFLSVRPLRESVGKREGGGPGRAKREKKTRVFFLSIFSFIFHQIFQFHCSLSSLFSL